jgi:hypothetical protein
MFLVILLLIPLIQKTTLVSADENLLKNSGFEFLLQDWSVSEGTATYLPTTANPHIGSYCAKGQELGEYSLGRLYQDITKLVSPGKKYKIGGWIKTSGVTSLTPPLGVVIALDYVDAEGWTPLRGYVEEIGNVLGTTDWTYYESSVFTLPPMPSDAVALWFLFDFNNGKGVAWFDGVFLIETGKEIPTLSNGYVTPVSGDTSTLFSYNVTYYDSAGIPPARKELYIDSRAAPETMELDSGSPSNGVYTCALTLPKGLHEFYFRFGDDENTITLPIDRLATGCFSGPRVHSPDEQIISEKMLTVPLFGQEADSCWAAASQMMLGFYGMYGPPISQQQWAMEVGNIDYYNHGLPPIAMPSWYAALERLGRVDVSEVVNLSFDTIKNEIDSNRPIFLRIGKGLGHMDIAHTVVCVGYVEMADPAQNEVFIQDSQSYLYGPTLELNSWESEKSTLWFLHDAVRTSPKTDKKEVAIHFGEERISGILEFRASSDVSSAWWTKARKWDGQSWTTIPGVPDEKSSEKSRIVDINIDANGAGYYKLILSADTETSWSVNVERKENVAAKLNIKARSPVNIMVTAPDGSRVGYDPEVGIVNEIPGATYSGPGSEPQEIMILDPSVGVYSVQAFATATGQYTIIMESVNSQGSAIDCATWQSNAVQGKQYIENVTLQSGQLGLSYDMTLVKVTPCNRLVGQGRCLDINVTVENKGEYAETCNITAYANTTLIETQQVTLSSKNSTTITFTWNTRGAAYGNYTIAARVGQFSNEIGKVGAYVTVGILSDLNSDGTVNILDIFIVANAFGSRPGDENWNALADLNMDGTVNILDIFAVAWDFGRTV